MKSDLGLGLVQAGGKLSYFNNTDPKAYKDIIRKAIRDGLRIFDSAYTYQNADELLSSVIKEQHIQREDYDITTKIMPLPTFKKKAEVCLKRLNVDFLDTLLIHWPTQDEALLFSTLKTLEALKEEKKCINIGVSNFPFTLLAKISRDFEINVLERAYSLIWTKEIDEAKLLGIKLYCYAPLGEGLLSGKYRRPEDLNDNRKQLWVFRYPPVYNQLLDKVSQIAKNHDVSMQEVALAFSRSACFDKIFIGVSKLNQLEIFSSKLSLLDDEIKQLRELADKLCALNSTDNIYEHRW